VICKTDGNPFFTNEFLKNLYTENLLVFDSTSGQWQWDLASIEAQGFTDNVVELMVGRLQKLAQPIQEVLSLAACLGAKFDLGTLALVGNRDAAEVFDDLKIAMEKGFIQARSQFDQNLLIQDYRFEHDRIQQAAYSLLSALQQTQTHYQIGQILYQHLCPEALEEELFTVVNHLNYGIELIDDRFRRDRLAQLNLAACCKAKDATAYQTAAEYAAIGLKFLGNDAWQRQYENTLSLHELAAEVSSLSGDFAQMHQWFDAVLAHTKLPIEQVGVYDVKIRALTSQSQPLEAISAGRSILLELGVQFPDHLAVSDIQHAVQDIIDLVQGDRAIAGLFDLSPMTDVEYLAKNQVLTSILAPCYQIGSPLFALVTALQVKLSIQYGNSPNSAFSYACYGFILCHFLQDVATGIQFGRLAYRLGSITKSIRCSAFFAISYYLTHRNAHLRETEPTAQSAYGSGIETGNLEYAGYSIYTFFLSQFWCGQPLAELEPRLLAYRQQLLNLNQLLSANLFSLLWEATIFLIGNSQEIELCFNQPPLVTNYLVLGFNTCQIGAMLQFLTGDLEMAIAFSDQAKAYIIGGVGTVSEAEFYFYDSLIVLSANVQPFNQEHLERIQANQTKLQHWAEYAPMNYLHKWQLVEAERCRVFGQRAEAIELYDLAIPGAKAHAYIQEEALSNELAAKFYLNWGKSTIARTYMIEARYGYLRWGATAKVEQLDSQYSQLLEPLGHEASSHSRSTFKTTGGSGAELDLATVMKASQAIATEIVLENLLQTLMRILLENAGAQSGCLLLHQARGLGEMGAFEIAARSSNDNAHEIEAQPIGEILPESVLYYVARTQENILIDCAVDSSNFGDDPYIQSVKPLSILCYPLIDRGKLVGIVYLENNITTGAFKSNRIELLQLLSGQAAIALENALLYAEKVEYTRTLEQKISDRTAELQLANQELLKLANLDGLTQIPNRRHFDSYLAEEWQRHLREQKILTLILIDIDYFKLYNDYYGHQGGDDCLIKVAQLIAKICQRPGDMVARYGGEEFIVILPSTHSNGALVVAESIQEAISGLAISHAKSEISEYVTLSLGIASLIPTPETSTEDLIAHADRALYAAKHKGRDRAIVYMRS
jgi:diguanylate cyclase (GGDEF)-like protein